MASQTTWFITGTSRGIGLEMVRHLVTDSSNLVIATCRNPTGAAALHALADGAKATLHVLQLDTEDDASINAVVAPTEKALGGRGLDYLVNNAAYMEGSKGAFDVNMDGIMKSFRANVAGPALLAQALLPLLERGHRKVIVNFTSGLASFGLDCGAKNAVYSISKAAINMLAYKQAKAKPELISFVVDPGWVKTDMGGEGAQLEPHESVTALLTLFKKADSSYSGRFWHYSGSEIVW